VVPGSGSERAEFADDGKHFSSAVSNALHPSIWSMCSIEGTCRQFWQPRSLATYGLTTPTRLDFKAEDAQPLFTAVSCFPRTQPAKFHSLSMFTAVPAGQTAPTPGMVSSASSINIWYSTVSLYSPSDNRGTPNRDKKFMAAIKGQFGAVELRDQLRLP